MQAQLVAGGNAPRADAQAGRHLVGVGAVGENLRLLRARAQKIRWDLQVASVPVGHAAQIPGVTMPVRQGDVLRRALR